MQLKLMTDDNYYVTGQMLDINCSPNFVPASTINVNFVMVGSSQGQVQCYKLGCLPGVKNGYD